MLDSKTSSLTNQQFGFAVGLYIDNQNVDQGLFSFTLEQVNEIVSLTQPTITQKPEVFEIERCKNAEHFQFIGEEHWLKQLNNQQVLFCINPEKNNLQFSFSDNELFANNTQGYSSDTTNYSNYSNSNNWHKYIRIKLVACKNISSLPKDQQNLCQNTTVLNFYIQQHQIQIKEFYNRIIVSPSEKSNYQNYLEQQSLYISSLSPTSLYYDLFQYSFTTDDGYLFQSINEQNVYDLRLNTEQNVLKSQQIPINFIGFNTSNILLYSISVEMNRQGSIFIKTYMKIYTALGLAGGFIKILLLVGSIIVGPIAEFQLKKNFLNQLFDFDSSKSEEGNLPYDQGLGKYNEKVIPPVQDISNIVDQKRCLCSNINQLDFDQSLRSYNNKGDNSINQINLKQCNSQLFKKMWLNNQGEQLQQLSSPQRTYKKINLKRTMIISNLLNYNGDSNNLSVNASNNINENNSNCNNNTNSNSVNLKTSSIIQNKNSKKNLSIVKLFQQLIDKDHTIKYNFLEFIQHKVFCKKFCRNKKIEQINNIQEIVNQRIDIVYILNKLVEIDKLKNLLLTQEQLKLFDFLPKPQINFNSQEDSQECIPLTPITVNQSSSRCINKWNLLSKTKPLIDKARDAYRVFQKYTSSKNQLPQIDLKLLAMLDSRVKYYFEASTNADATKQKSMPSIDIKQNRSRNKQEQYLDTDFVKSQEEKVEKSQNSTPDHYCEGSNLNQIILFNCDQDKQNHEEIPSERLAHTKRERIIENDIFQQIQLSQK